MRLENRLVKLEVNAPNKASGDATEYFSKMLSDRWQGLNGKDFSEDWVKRSSLMEIICVALNTTDEAEYEHAVGRMRKIREAEGQRSAFAASMLKLISFLDEREAKT